MPRQLVTCPVCKTDQHVRKGLICNHTSDGGLRCSGSHEPVRPSLKKIEAHIKEQVRVGTLTETRDGLILNRPTLREALIALSYTEAKPGKWIKPIGFQAFSYIESTGVWTCWFKTAGGETAIMESKTFGDLTGSPFRERDYIRQLKEWEQWTKKDVYTDSHFELGAIDL